MTIKLTSEQERIIDSVMDGLALHVSDVALAKAREDFVNIPCNIKKLKAEEIIDVFMRLASTYQRACDYGNNKNVHVSDDIKLLALKVGGLNETSG